jgi:hypothetical protein
MRTKNQEPRNKTLTSAAQPGIVVQKITIRPVERSRSDVQSWRKAHQAAESYSKLRRQLYDLYSDVIVDGFTSETMNKRIRAVTNGGIMFFDKSGKEVDAVTKYIYSLAFHHLLKEIALTHAWGVTVLEYIPQTKSWYSVPRKHIWPHDKKITWEQSGGDGIHYNQPPESNYIVQVGDDDDLGYLLRVTPLVLYKRGNLGDWAQFAEIFGMPFREYRYNGYDEKTRQELEVTAEKTGGAAYAILPQEAEFKIHPNNSTGSKDVYNGFHDTVNKEILISILGNTETTQSSSSSGYAQSETHLKTEAELKDDDRRWVERVLNEKILPIMALHGWPVEGGYFAYPEAKKQLTLDEELKLAGSMPIARKYFYEKYNIPMPEASDELVSQQSAVSTPLNESQESRTKNQDLKKPKELSAEHHRFFG